MALRLKWYDPHLFTPFYQLLFDGMFGQDHQAEPCWIAQSLGLPRRQDYHLRRFGRTNPAAQSI